MKHKNANQNNYSSQEDYHTSKISDFVEFEECSDDEKHKLISDLKFKKKTHTHTIKPKDFNIHEKAKIKISDR